MAGSTFIQVPPNLEDIQSLRRFLDKLVQQLDVAFGNRGTNKFSSQSSVNQLIEGLNNLVIDTENYAKLDGSREFIGTIRYSELPVFSSATDIIAKGYVDTNFSAVDGSTDYTGIVSYSTAQSFTQPNQLISKSYADNNFTYNPKQLDMDNLSLTPSATYVSTELKSVADKVDSILASLRLANILGS